MFNVIEVESSLEELQEITNEVLKSMNKLSIDMLLKLIELFKTFVRLYKILK